MAGNQKSKGFQEFKQIMARLSWPERLEYLWEYYKWVLFAAFVVVIIIGIISTCIYQMQLETLFAGHAVNVDINAAGTAYVTDQWFDLLGGVEGDHEVNLYTTQFQDPEANRMDYNGASAMSVLLLISSQDLDYVIMDAEGMGYIAKQGVFAPLEKLLTPEQLSQISEDRFIFLQDENGNTFPGAIDISELPFVRDCVTGDGPIYIAFPGNTPRAELSAQFWDYLLSWEAEN